MIIFFAKLSASSAIPISVSASSSLASLEIALKVRLWLLFMQEQ